MGNYRFLEEPRKMVIIISLLLFIILIGINNSFGEIIPPERKIDWSPGIPGGIPSRTTICANVKNAPYNAAGDDSTDDTSAIQSAINACPSNQVVYIPAGTYKVTSELSITKGIVVRGEGPELTNIKNYSTTTGDIFDIRGTLAGSAIAVTSGYTKGSQTITVASTTGLAVNNYIRIYQTNDPNVVKDGYGSTCSWCVNVIAQVVQITAISGNNISINKPLYYTYNATYNPSIKKLGMIEYVGIEDLKLEKVYGGASYSATNNIRLEEVAKCWIKNIESYKVVGAHVRINGTYACEIRDSFFNSAHATSSGRGYGVFFLSDDKGEVSSDNLIENNIFYKLRHAMNIEGGAQGNVFAYNYSKDPNDNTVTSWMEADGNINHAKHGMFNLMEGNILAKIHADNTFGSSSYNTFFRNQVTRESLPSITQAHWAVVIDENNSYYNIVGNVLCKPGCQGQYEPADIDSSTKVIWRIGYHAQSDTDSSNNVTEPGTTLLRHGNFDYISNTTIWDPTITDHSLPNSLYLLTKPSFFRDRPWPAIGPDLNPMVGMLPAIERFNAPRPPKLK